jgi:hypothetical protein
LFGAALHLSALDVMKNAYCFHLTKFLFENYNVISTKMTQGIFPKPTVQSAVPGVSPEFPPAIYTWGNKSISEV